MSLCKLGLAVEQGPFSARAHVEGWLNRITLESWLFPNSEMSGNIQGIEGQWLAGGKPVSDGRLSLV